MLNTLCSGNSSYQDAVLCSQPSISSTSLPDLEPELPDDPQEDTIADFKKVYE